MRLKQTLTGLILVPLLYGLGCSEAHSDETPVPQNEAGPYVSRGLDRRGLKDPKVKAAMSQVPRHQFIPLEMQEQAYDDRAVAIGHGQTISQPYIVALMTEHAGVTQGSKVLEIGTGSGYQAAVLAE